MFKPQHKHHNEEYFPCWESEELLYSKVYRCCHFYFL